MSTGAILEFYFNFIISLKKKTAAFKTTRIGWFFLGISNNLFLGQQESREPMVYVCNSLYKQLPV